MGVRARTTLCVWSTLSAGCEPGPPTSASTRTWAKMNVRPRPFCESEQAKKEKEKATRIHIRILTFINRNINVNLKRGRKHVFRQWLGSVHGPMTVKLSEPLKAERLGIVWPRPPIGPGKPSSLLGCPLCTVQSLACWLTVFPASSLCRLLRLARSSVTNGRIGVSLG